MIIIQARSTSKRLPNKCMMDINGFPMIYWVLSSCLARREHRVVLAIPNQNSEKSLLNFVKKEFPEIYVVRGSEENVYLRFRQALEEYLEEFKNENPSLGLVRVCADRPLLSSRLLSNLKHTQNERLELLYNHETGEENGPSGIGAESFSKSLALEFFLGRNLDWIDTEHVSSQLYKRMPFLCKAEESLRPLRFLRKINYSVDDIEDLEVVRRIVHEFDMSPGDDVDFKIFEEIERYLCNS